MEKLAYFDRERITERVVHANPDNSPSFEHPLFKGNPKDLKIHSAFSAKPDSVLK